MNTLGLKKQPSETRVVVAMSGGVDSSVTAALLREQGYDVIGVTLKLYESNKKPDKKGGCCAGQDIIDAGEVATKIGIPHYILDYKNKFHDGVIEPFAASYTRGETPVPCILCNQTVKFQDLLNTAQDLDADILATGHYIRRIETSEGPALYCAIDETKDQSYFLFATTKDQLAKLRFPLGQLKKAETRELADKLGLQTAFKPDSQDICFVPEGRYSDVIKRIYPEAVKSGNIVDLVGNVLGNHNGIINYTVGQRRGLKIGGAGSPLYVVKLVPDRNQVVVGPVEALEKKTIRLRDVNWLVNVTFGEEIECDVRVRSSQVPTRAIVRPLEQSDASVKLATATRGVAPGQACVFYREERLLGGGWITKQ